MGQFIEVLNNQANLDDLNLNLDIQGGLDCNVDEVSRNSINHFMSINHFAPFVYISLARNSLKNFFHPRLKFFSS